eukprot:Phypoly_transcript_08267.p1 GENE.Phypoly_transcript_08267~~Phypoly_transcript_08267.p1  ORF type:complete len:388 (+),score=56.20 Phypoly_transcript_08267:98-1165(+)
MGNLCGTQGPVGSPEEAKANEDINTSLRKEKSRIDSEIKLLLLGAGESGKSTIAKQMKFLFMDGFNNEERESYKGIIASNTVGSMRVLVAAAADMGIEIKEHKDAADRFMSETSGSQFSGALTPSIGKDIKALWSDPAIKLTYSRSSEFQLNDSAGYYFDSIDRLTAPDYQVSQEDVLRSRTKTTGIIETEFDVKGTHFRMVDVGGQRSERKKWMYCFQDVTAVLFCVALSEYDLKLYEDDTTNRMHESIKLFKEICNTKWFVNTSMILFLNKKDLFAGIFVMVFLSPFLCAIFVVFLLPVLARCAVSLLWLHYLSYCFVVFHYFLFFFTVRCSGALRYWVVIVLIFLFRKNTKD